MQRSVVQLEAIDSKSKSQARETLHIQNDKVNSRLFLGTTILYIGLRLCGGESWLLPWVPECLGSNDFLQVRDTYPTSPSITCIVYLAILIPSTPNNLHLENFMSTRDATRLVDASFSVKRSLRRESTHTHMSVHQITRDPSSRVLRSTI